MFEANPPLVGDDPKILILGTFPSPLSREKTEYYGNPQNKFWRIIFDIFHVPFDHPSYEEKKAVLFGHGLALWDVIVRCEVVGALDSNIKNPVYNTALPDFIRRHAFEKVLFNGGNSFAFYRRGIGEAPRTVLPSTSPANARYGYADKLKAWADAVLG